MAQTYDKNDILHVLKGAAFLGAGGGGSMEYGLNLLNQLETMGYEAKFDLLSIDEMEEDAYGAMVAALGQPTALKPDNLADDITGAFRALQIACTADGHDLKYLYSGEMGGFNTLVPIFLSIISGKDPAKRVKVLDADLNGRAVPALDTSLTSARGIPPSPLGMAGHKQGEPQYRYISWPDDSKGAEILARALGGGWYSLIGFSTWAMPKQQIIDNAGVNYISYAKRIGEALDNAAMPLFDALHSVIPQIKEFFSGQIEKIIIDGSGGFDKGTLVIKDRGSGDTKIGILFLNESILVGTYENGEITNVALTIPDLISMVDTDTRKPLTNDNVVDIKEGQNVTVFLSPAHYYWWDSKNAYKCFQRILDLAGYKGPFVPYNPMFERNRPQGFPALQAMNLQLAYASPDQAREQRLNDLLNANIYNDGKNYVESFTAKGYFTPDDKGVTDPSVTEQDIVKTGPKILQLAKERYMNGDVAKPWAGHFVSHFGDDKTLRALREAVSRQVFDAFDPAVLLSLALANRVSVLTWPETMVPIIERKIAAAALEARIVSVRAIKAESVKTLPDELAEAAKLAIDSDGAQAVIIGRSFWPEDGSANPDYNLALEVQNILAKTPEYAVPVLDPNRVGARWLEMCAHMGYFHSRLSYLAPPAKNVQAAGNK